MPTENKTVYNRIQLFPNEKYHRMFIADAFLNGEKKAAHGEMIVKKYYDNLSETRQKILRETYEKMTDEERLKPGKFSNNEY